VKNNFYITLHFILKPFIKLLFPFTVQGVEHLPADKPVVLCVNHTNAVDPVVLAFALPRTYRLRIMAKKQLFSIPGLNWLIRKLGAFPVDRGNNDIGAVKISIGALREGYSLMIFPEGTRVKEGETVEPKSGAAMIAIRSGVEMVPVYISANKRLFRKTRIIIGAPYAPVYTGRKGTAEEYQQNIDEVMRRVYAMGETV
jgi:1-acyl-sn-glycerol-3-phosphate acyltransferase